MMRRGFTGRVGRRALLLALAASAGACTLRPLYGPASGGASAAPKRIALSSGGGRPGYLLREAMRRRFTLDDSAPDRLNVDVQISSRDLAVTTQGDTTRINLDGTARFTLTREGSPEPVSGAVRSVAGYDTLGSPYAARVARDAAEERVIHDLADRLFAQIALLTAGRA
jgi:LPS-assembly lipoprotein